MTQIILDLHMPARDVIGVVACAARHPVGPCAAVQRVIAAQPDQGLTDGAAGQGVCTCVAGSGCSSGRQDQVFHTDSDSDAGAGYHRIRPATDNLGDRIGPGIPRAMMCRPGQVLDLACGQGIVKGGGNSVNPAVCQFKHHIAQHIDNIAVIAQPTDHRVNPGPAVQHIIAVRARDRV